MKYLSALAAFILTLWTVAIVATFSFLPSEPTPEVSKSPSTPVKGDLAAAPLAIQPVVAPVVVDHSQIETELARREAIYQDQIAQLDQALQERQATYLSQLETLNAQLTAAQNQFDSLKLQEENLLAKVAELDTIRAERLSAYQTQLQQAQEQYGVRYAEAEAMLGEIQTKLAEANVQLGR
jgi:hypothetical protein